MYKKWLYFSTPSIDFSTYERFITMQKYLLYLSRIKSNLPISTVESNPCKKSNLWTCLSIIRLNISIGPIMKNWKSNAYASRFIYHIRGNRPPLIKPLQSQGGGLLKFFSIFVQKVTFGQKKWWFNLGLIKICANTAGFYLAGPVGTGFRART